MPVEELKVLEEKKDSLIERGKNVFKVLERLPVVYKKLLGAYGAIKDHEERYEELFSDFMPLIKRLRVQEVAEFDGPNDFYRGVTELVSEIIYGFDLGLTDDFIKLIKDYSVIFKTIDNLGSFNYGGEATKAYSSALTELKELYKMLKD
jgi:hypothetical protein